MSAAGSNPAPSAVLVCRLSDELDERVALLDRVAHRDLDGEHVGHHLGEDLDALFAGHGQKLADGPPQRSGWVRPGSGRSVAPESSVRARRPEREPVSSRSRRMTTAPMSTPRITEYSVVSPASASVSEGSRKVWVTCAAAVTPKAQTHHPCRRRARMWTPHIRAGTPSNAWTGRGAPCSVSSAHWRPSSNVSTSSGAPYRRSTSA